MWIERRLQLGLKAGLLLGALAFAGAAQAQSMAGGAEPGDAAGPDASQDRLATSVAVTAMRREQTLQQVPLALTALSADDLEARTIQSTLGLMPFVPNLFASSAPGLGSASSYYIRGLGNTETALTFEPAVATFVDDIQLARPNGSNFSFFNVSRIEVLRGPQGALYGRNTGGGAIRVLLQRPGTDIGGYGEVAYGAYDRKLLRGSIDLPVGSAFGFKLSGYYQADDGYVRNTTTGETLNDSDGAGLRGAVRLQLTDTLEWNGAVTYMRASGENLANVTCDPRAPGTCDGRYAATGLREDAGLASALPISGRKASFGLGNETDTVLVSSNFEWRQDKVTLSLITGVVSQAQKFHLDLGDGRALPTVAEPVPPPGTAAGYGGGYGLINDGSHRQFSQEVRLAGSVFDGALEFVAGALLTDETNRNDVADVRGGPAGPAVLADRILDTATSSVAGYVHGDLSLSSALTLSAGVRFTDETRTLRIGDNRPQCNTGAAAGCLTVAVPFRQKASIWTPRVALSYAANDNFMMFASAARGYRGGGWDGRATMVTELLPFGPETVWTYEAGIRTEWFDKRLRLNVTGFFMDVQNAQTPSDFVRADGSLGFASQSVADYRNQGLEVELAAMPVAGLSVFATLGVQNPSYRSGATTAQQQACIAQLAAGRIPLSPEASNAAACARGIVDANGALARPVRAPTATVAAGASYDWRLPAAGIIITPSANGAFTSRYETATANGTIYAGTSRFGAVTYPANPFGATVLTGSAADSFVVVNAGLAMRTDDDHWTLALECRNCLDTAWQESSVGNVTYLGYPRYWQVRAKRVF